MGFLNSGRTVSRKFLTYLRGFNLPQSKPSIKIKLALSLASF